jgi:hypothetical protein
MSIELKRRGVVLGSVRVLSAIALLLCTFSGCSSGLRNKDPRVRLAAVQKLTDQSLLEKVAFEDQDEQVREAAVARITDQVILARLATQHTNAMIRMQAVWYLSDPVVLDKIVTNEKESVLIRQIANKRLQQVTGVDKYQFVPRE